MLKTQNALNTRRLQWVLCGFKLVILAMFKWTNIVAGKLQICKIKWSHRPTFNVILRYLFTQYICIEVKLCEVITYHKLKTIESFKEFALKVVSVACETLCILRGSDYSDWQRKFRYFANVVDCERWLLREVWL